MFDKLVAGKIYQQASSLIYMVKPYIKYNKDLGQIINELKKIYSLVNKVPKQDYHDKIKPIPSTESSRFKQIEKEITDLIRKSRSEDALLQIQEEIKKNIPAKYISSLLLKKAQIFSTLSNSIESEKAYKELITYNEKIKSPPNNLSHLYTELARIQALNPDKLSDAYDSLETALKYNDNNTFARNLLRQIDFRLGRKSQIQPISESFSEEFIVDVSDDNTTISKLIDFDIQDHKYSHTLILKNGGVPTEYIARQILAEAKKIKGRDLSERYPLYLEAGKAFSELNVGSYDLQNYQEAVSYYSMLKGNSLFFNFRRKVLRSEIDLI